MVDIGGSFDKTLNRFGISAAWLSRESGINQQMISRFRNGKEIQTDTLEKLLFPLSLEARQYFFSLLLDQSLKVNLEKVINEMNEQELKQVLFAIAGRMVASKDKNERDLIVA